MSWLVGNWKLKLLAAALAVGLLAAVAFSENPPVATVAPVHVSYQNLPPGLVLVDQPSTVNVNVVGLSNAVKQFRQTSVGAVVDVSGAHSGAGQTFDARVMTAAANVSFPSTTIPVTLDIEPVVTRQIGVDVLVPNVQRQQGISVVPDGTYATCGSDQQACKVTVTAPRSVLDGLKAYVSFDLVINAAGIERAPELPVRFEKNGKPFNLRGVHIDPEIISAAPDSVTARVQTQGGAMSKTVAVAVKASGQPGCGYRIDGLSIQPDAFADITGSIDVVSKIDAISLDPVNISGATSPQIFNRDLNASVSGVHVVSPAGGQVTVTVSISQAFSCAAPTPNPAPAPTQRPSPSPTR
jgi:YbbR domain-containing protein